MKASAITHALHSHSFSVTFGAVMLVALAYVYYHFGSCPLPGERGFALPSPSQWLPDGWLNFGIAMVANACVMTIAALLNKVYNILRSMTGMYIAMYGAMLLGTPQLAVSFNAGVVTAMVVALGLYLLFGHFRSSRASESIFTVFAVLSALTATQYSFAVFIPAFLVICAQLRILNMRTIIATLFGMVTPWWIYFGFGIISVGDLHWPQFENIFTSIDDYGKALIIVATALTCLMLLLSLALNLFRTIAYNARSRAYNGAVTIIALFAVIGIGADFTNFWAYLPTLYLGTALQTAHYFSNHRSERSWIGISAIFAVYIALFACQVAALTL